MGFICPLLISLVVVCILGWFLSLSRLTNLQDWNKEQQRVLDVAAAVMDFVCDYDPQNNDALNKFRPVACKSQCLFAKSAVLWGCCNWDTELSLEANVRQSLPMLLQFILRSSNSTPGQPMEELDGFVFEIRGDDYCKSVRHFGEAVRRVLTEISRSDPKKEHCMKKSYIGSRGWHFRFAGKPIFVTSFAPCYQHHSSRYMFGQSSSSSFVLLQPESSFLYHQLPPDTPTTNWTEPATIRDRIRASFRKHGREYEIPKVVSYPPAHHIVKPADWREDGVVKWWQNDKNQKHRGL